MQKDQVTLISHTTLDFPHRSQYVGDLQTMEFHLIMNHKPRCRVDECVTSGHAVIFEPDTNVEAALQGFDPCPHCVGLSDPWFTDPS